MDRTTHHKQIFAVSILVILLSFPSNQLYAEVVVVAVHDPIKVGVILDLGSSVGKVIRSCINMAVSDFYSLNPHYKTRIVLHLEDSHGQPLHVLSAALDLLENTKVQAIIGLETPLGSKNLAKLRNKIKVPILSFTSSTSSSNQNPYFIHITQDETKQFKGIADYIVDSFHEWTTVILIFEDTNNGREILLDTIDNFQERYIHINHISLISPSASSDQIIAEIYKFKNSQTTTFVVHMSPSLASCLFSNVKMLGMMREGYAWIVTDKTMNFLHSMDSSVIETMEGALGFKSYIPPSSDLRNFTIRWRKKVLMEEPNMEVMMDLNVFGIWAYDATWGLATALERANNIKDSLSGSSILLNELTQLSIKGLSGDFQLVNGKLVSNAFEVVNVFGKIDRRVGFWTLKEGIIKEMHPQVNFQESSPKRGLKAINWPGGYTTTPKHRLISTKLRIAVAVNLEFPELVKMTLDPQTNATTFTGFCIDVFNATIAELHYDVPYELIKLERQSYNDLIYQVFLQKVDGVVGDVTITANRSLYADFTLPYTDLGVGTIARNDNNNNMWVFLEPLDSKLWLASACFIVLTGFVVWVIEHPMNEEFQGSTFQQIANVFLFSFSTIVSANRGEILLSNLSRFIVIVWVFVVLILTSTYTATLSSLLTVQQFQFASKSNYIYIGYQSGSFVGGTIVSNVNFENYKLREYCSQEEYHEALSKGHKNGGVDAIIDEIPYLKIFLERYASHGYAMVASESSTNGFAFAFRKGSPLVFEMSRAIAKLRAEKKLIMMEEKWFKTKSSLISKDSQTNTITSGRPRILNLDSFRGLFLITGVSSALALLVHTIHKLHEKWGTRIYHLRILLMEKSFFMIKYHFANYNSKVNGGTLN